MFTFFPNFRLLKSDKLIFISAHSVLRASGIPPCLSLVKRAQRETQNLLIPVGRRSNPRTSRIVANSRLISIFFLLLFLELLSVLFSLVFAKRSFPSVFICCQIPHSFRKFIVYMRPSSDFVK